MTYSGTCVNACGGEMESPTDAAAFLCLHRAFLTHDFHRTTALSLAFTPSTHLSPLATSPLPRCAFFLAHFLLFRLFFSTRTSLLPSFSQNSVLCFSLNSTKILFWPNIKKNETAGAVQTNRVDSLSFQTIPRTENTSPRLGLYDHRWLKRPAHKRLES